ncbi:MAG TPA: PilZ domain-containing protein [Allosphingosinicella sp.]
MASQIPLLPSQDERGSGREDVSYDASIWEPGSPPATATVTNLSQLGCGLVGCSVRGGASIWLRIGALPPVQARVVWAKGGEAGCQFTAPLDRRGLTNEAIPAVERRRVIFGSGAPRPTRSFGRR